MKTILLTAVLAAAPALAAASDVPDPSDEPRPVPLTRPEMKQSLEDMKARKPRIPLPELTAEEREQLGERGGGYESRLRSLYLNDGRERSAAGAGRTGGTAGTGRTGGSGFFGGFGRDPDPKMTLDYKFKTQLFWIVSRTNNCQYCLGHQESKLLAAGMTENEIAALDGEWVEFAPAEQAAYAFARKITFEPHLIGDADVERLRRHYTDLQILEMVLSIAGNNAINRWKEGVGVPQSSGGGGFGRRRADGEPEPARTEAHSYLTPTADEFRDRVTKVAPLVLDAETGEPTRRTVFRRPPLESQNEVEQELAFARKRSPRLPLVDEAEAREVLGEDAPAGALPQWIRLLANFPRDGRSRILAQLRADQTGDLSPLLKAQVSWIIARQDRAWYAVGEAKRRLGELGQTDEEIYALDGDWQSFTPAERALFTVARKLAATPVVLTDDDVDEALALTGPRDVVQLISYTTGRASFDRITQAAGLRLEQ
ncbi:MAG TPA: carboxymuconolactone decarboxylase family protein [Planctomycetaceae bacterium]|nr:carboxymuconolactone decarboxylase family protein [Planctomycetaceae bacterium]